MPFGFFKTKEKDVKNEEMGKLRRQFSEWLEAQEDVPSPLEETSSEMGDPLNGGYDEIRDKYADKLQEIERDISSRGLNFNTYQEQDLHDDLQVIDYYIEYNKEDLAEYLMFNIRIKEDGDEEWTEMWKAVKLARLKGFPRSFREEETLLTTWDDVLIGLHDKDINFITVMANILKPERIGLVFCYGVQSIAETPEQAKEMADIGYEGLIRSLIGNFPQIEFRLLTRQEADWIDRQMREMKHLLMLRGIPRPRNSAGTSTTLAIGGTSANARSEEQNEEFLRGMSDVEYLLLLLTSPVGFKDMQRWLTITSNELSKYKSEMAGTKGINIGMSIPVVFMGNLGAALGRNFGETNTFGHAVSLSESDSTGVSFTTGTSESISSSHSEGVSQSVSVSQGNTHTVGFSESQGVSYSEGVSFTEGFSRTEGTSFTEGISHGVGRSFTESVGESITSTESVGTSESASVGTSQSVSVSVGTSETNSLSQSVGTSQSVGHSTTVGSSVGRGFSENWGTSFSTGTSLSESASNSTSQGFSVGTSESSSISNSQSQSSSFGTSSGVGTSSTLGTSVGSATSSVVGQSQTQSVSQSQGTSDSVGTSQSWGANNSQSNSWGNSQTNSVGTSQGTGGSVSQSQSQSTGTSASTGSSTSSGFSAGTSESFGSSQSSSNSFSHSQSSSVGTSQGSSAGVSTSTGISAGVSTGLSAGKTVSVTESESNGFGTSQGTSAGTSTSQGQGFSESHSGGISQSHGTSFSSGQSSGQSFSVGQGSSTGTSTGVSEGSNWSSGTSSSQSAGTSVGGGTSSGVSTSTGLSQGSGTSQSQGTSSATSVSQNTGVTQSNGTSQSVGNSTSQGVSQSQGTGTSTGTGQSTGTSRSQSFSGSTGTSVSSGVSQGVSQTQGMGQSSSTSQSISNGVSTTTGTSESVGRSTSVGTSQSLSQGAGQSQGFSQGTSQGFSQGTSQTRGQSYGTSVSDTLSQSQGTSQSVGTSVSQGTSASRGVSTSVGKSTSDSVSLSSSQGMGKSVTESIGLSKGTSVSEGISMSKAVSQGATDSTSLALATGMSHTQSTGTSSSMGLGPSLGYSKSAQWFDENKANLVKFLDEQRNRLVTAIKQGAFYVDVFILTPDAKSKKAASVLSSGAWYGDVFPCPVQIVEPDPVWAEHLMTHAAVFSACTMPEDASELMEGYKFSTILLPQEMSAYCHPPRFEGGDMNTVYEAVPFFHLPGKMNGEAFMGWCISAETGSVTSVAYRFDKRAMMHTLICGASGSGKTTTSLRFISELINNMKFGATILDWKDDWRSLAYVIPKEKFSFYSLGTTMVNRLQFNPLAVPAGVDIDLWIDTVVESFVIGFGLGQRGYEILWRNLARLYSKSGVWVDATKSKRLSLYDLRNEIQSEIDDKGQKKQAGFGDVEAYNRVLSRMGYFANEDSRLYTMFGKPTNPVPIEDLCKPGSVVVLEAQGMKGPQKSFLLGLIAAGVFQVARAQKCFVERPHMIVFEEAHEVVKGTDTASSDSASSGVTEESIYEVMWNEGRSAGLYLVALAQMPTHLPTSVLANTRVYISHQLGNDEDIDFITRRMIRDPRIEHKDFPRFLERIPLGQAIVQCRNIRHHRDAEPVLIQVEMIEAPRPTDSQLRTMMIEKQGFEYVA